MAQITLNPPPDHVHGPNTRDGVERGDSWKTAVDNLNTMLGDIYSIGTGTIDFGAFPGAADATLVITGQTRIAAGSIVRAWIVAVATADHSVDEHLINPPRITAGNIVPGTGFTIYGNNDDRPYGQAGGDNLLTYGTWSVMWRWQ